MPPGTIRMRALVTDDAEGLRKGQTFSTTPAKAASLRYLRKADFIDEQAHRREQHARDSEPASVAVSTDVEPDAPTEARRGSRSAYRRRDMRAEDADKA